MNNQKIMENLGQPEDKNTVGEIEILDQEGHPETDEESFGEGEDKNAIEQKIKNIEESLLSMGERESTGEFNMGPQRVALEKQLTELRDKLTKFQN
jgi:hypothetical protein